MAVIFNLFVMTEPYTKHLFAHSAMPMEIHTLCNDVVHKAHWKSEEDVISQVINLSKTGFKHKYQYSNTGITQQLAITPTS